MRPVDAVTVTVSAGSSAWHPVGVDAGGAVGVGTRDFLRAWPRRPERRCVPARSREPWALRFGAEANPGRGPAGRWRCRGQRGLGASCPSAATPRASDTSDLPRIRLLHGEGQAARLRGGAGFPRGAGTGRGSDWELEVPTWPEDVRASPPGADGPGALPALNTSDPAGRQPLPPCSAQCHSPRPAGSGGGGGTPQLGAKAGVSPRVVPGHRPL